MDPKIVDELVERYSMSEADKALLSTMFAGGRAAGDSPTITAAVTLDSGLRAAPDPVGRVAEPDLTPPTSSARYEDRGVIGTGGMGEVRRVFDRSLNRTMAMKIIRPERLADTLTRMRFIEEAQANAQLQHPGIVPVHEIGRLDDGRLYFTMKEVRGRTMAELIAEVHEASHTEWRRSPTGWTFRRLVSAFQQICRTVAYAHSRGIVHRDLKPKNVMLGEFGEAMVLDWGLAKPVGQVLALPVADLAVDTGRTVDTRAGAVAGTPAFMSPEQASGSADLDPRSDIYSLGAILYAILSDRPPYQGTSADAVVRMVQGGAPEPPGRVGGPEVPQDLGIVVGMGDRVQRAQSTHIAGLGCCGDSGVHHIKGRVDGGADVGVAVGLGHPEHQQAAVARDHGLTERPGVHHRSGHRLTQRPVRDVGGGGLGLGDPYGQGYRPQLGVSGAVGSAKLHRAPDRERVAVGGGVVGTGAGGALRHFTRGGDDGIAKGLVRRDHVGGTQVGVHLRVVQRLGDERLGFDGHNRARRCRGQRGRQRLGAHEVQHGLVEVDRHSTVTAGAMWRQGGAGVGPVLDQHQVWQHGRDVGSQSGRWPRHGIPWAPRARWGRRHGLDGSGWPRMVWGWVGRAGRTGAENQAQ